MLSGQFQNSALFPGGDPARTRTIKRIECHMTAPCVALLPLPHLSYVTLAVIIAFLTQPIHKINPGGSHGTQAWQVTWHTSVAGHMAHERDRSHFIWSTPYIHGISYPLPVIPCVRPICFLEYGQPQDHNTVTRLTMTSCPPRPAHSEQRLPRPSAQDVYKSHPCCTLTLRKRLTTLPSLFTLSPACGRSFSATYLYVVFAPDEFHCTKVGMKVESGE